MKQVIRIEMANDNDIYEVVTGPTLSVKKIANDDFVITLGNDIIDEAYTQQAADEALIKLAIDDDIVVTGYGQYAGRKYWQLPEELQAQIQKLAE